MIRPITSDDIYQVAELWLELVTYHQPIDDAMPSPAMDGVQRYAARLQNSLDDTYAKVFVAENTDDNLVGFVVAAIVDLLPEMFEIEKTGFIADIFVIEDYRGQGIGQQLVEAAEGWFRSRQIPHYEWSVAAANQAGYKFWRSIGGRDVMIRMRKELD